MAFILGSVIIGAGASIIGGAISASGQKSAAKTAAAGSDRELEFARESRDLARADQAPYREAGTEALSALMSLTGLGGSQVGGRSLAPRGPQGAIQGEGRAIRSIGQASNRAFRERGSAYRIRAKAYGGNTYSRAEGGPMYNVNEIGPENRYVGGGIRRGRGPSTINGETGYVEPNEPPILRGGGSNWVADSLIHWGLIQGMIVVGALGHPVLEGNLPSETLQKCGLKEFRKPSEISEISQKTSSNLAERLWNLVK